MIGTRPLIIPNKELQDKVDSKYRRDMETIERYVNNLTVPPSTGIQWEAVSIPDSDWDLTDSIGSWSVAPAGITQADSTAGAAILFTTTNYPALAWAIQADITVPTFEPGGVAMVGAGFQSTFCIAALDTGNADSYTDVWAAQTDNGGNYVPGGGVTNSGVQQGTTILTLDDTFTIRAIYLSESLQVFLNGTLEGRNFVVSPSNVMFALAGDSRFILMTRWFNGTTRTKMPATFANVKAWRIPIPTLV